MCDSSGISCTLVGSCSTIIDSSINPESDCAGLTGNTVKILGAANSQLGINSIGIFSDCDCTKTSFLSSNMP